MNETEILTGAAMLETMWESRHKNLLDLITPFVLYAVSQKKAKGEIIDISYTVKYVRENCGYENIPASIVQKILNRNPEKCIKRMKKDYILIGSLDSYISEFEEDSTFIISAEVFGKGIEMWLNSQGNVIERL